MSTVNSVNGLTQKCGKLPKGKIKELAIQFGVSPGYVGQVKSGTRNNLEILEAITIEVEKYKRKTEQLRKRLQKAKI